MATGKAGFPYPCLDGYGPLRELGLSGALCRMRYSVRWPSLTCDCRQLARTKGACTGASLTQFPMVRGDRIVAGRGYSTGRRIGPVAVSGGHVTVRLNTGALVVLDDDGHALDWVECLHPLSKPGVIGAEGAGARVGRSGAMVRGRLRALHKSVEAIRTAQATLRKEASKQSLEPGPST